MTAARARSRALSTTALLALALTGCPSERPSAGAAAAPDEATAEPSATPTTLVVYCGRGEGLVGSFLSAYDEGHPEVVLDVRYNKTPALASQVQAEGAECPADVIWLQDSGFLGALAEGGRLAPLPEDVLARVEPRFREAGGRWVGVTGRLRVLVYDEARTQPSELPRTLAELTEPKWKGKVGWAPANASFQAHLSALRHMWGEERAAEWLRAFQANEPARYPKNGPQVLAVARGEVTLGWVNHYYRHKLKADAPTVRNYSFPAAGDAGNVLMVAGIAARAGSPHQAQAVALVRWLLEAETQARFAQETFEYPLVAGVPTHPDVRPLSEVGLAPVEQVHLADVAPTLELLEQLGLP